MLGSRKEVRGRKREREKKGKEKSAIAAFPSFPSSLLEYAIRRGEGEREKERRQPRAKGRGNAHQLF